MLAGTIGQADDRRTYGDSAVQYFPETSPWRSFGTWAAVSQPVGLVAHSTGCHPAQGGGGSFSEPLVYIHVLITKVDEPRARRRVLLVMLPSLHVTFRVLPGTAAEF
jgi:hypothetical protein